MLAGQDPAASLRLLMKLAGGGDLTQIDTAAFLEQAVGVRLVSHTVSIGRAGVPDLDTDALDNGGLGKVGGWSQRAKDGADLILEDGEARLGGYHAGRDELGQKVRIGCPIASRIIR